VGVTTHMILDLYMYIHIYRLAVLASHYRSDVMMNTHCLGD